MNVSTWSIRHPVPAILLFTLLTWLGLFSFRTLGIQSYPTVDLPIVLISATQEGMAPSQLESEVARKIENAVAPLSLIRHIRTTIVDGAVSLVIEFNLKTAVSRFHLHDSQEIGSPEAARHWR